MSAQDDLNSNANPFSSSFGVGLNQDDARKAGEERRYRFPGENLTKPTGADQTSWSWFTGN